MTKPQPFVVPAGVNFQITDAGVVIENEGDIVLHTNFGRSLTRIVSTAGSILIHAPVDGGTIQAAGDVTIQGDTRADSVQAGGSVTVAGNAHVTTLAAGGNVAVLGAVEGTRVDAGGDVGITGAYTGSTVRAAGTVDIGGAVKADTLHADTLRFAGSSIAARGIQGASAVYIGAAKLQVDAILAPAVHLDPATSGRSTVIESQNELGPNAIKGGFRLVDYAEMFGDPGSFLTDRGLSPLGSAVAAAPAIAAPVRAEPVPAPVYVEPKAAPVAAEPVAAEPAAPAIEPTDFADTLSAPEVEIEDTEAEAEAAIADLPAVEVDEAGEADEPDASALPPEHPLHQQLVEAVTRISESYADAELPPAVNHLMSLIETRSYDQVRAEITSIWSDLLKYHQKKGLRIQHQVTTTFNTINSLVKKM
jgi:hypothetical protein